MSVPDEAVDAALDVFCDGIGNATDRDVENMRSALEAARPHLTRNRVVSTVEELDALPEGTVVRDNYGEVGERINDGKWWTVSPGVLESRELALPVTILYEPGGRS